MLIPFLFELRVVIDWIFTPTSLTFAEWIRVESIYAQAFQVKCNRVNAEEYPRALKVATWRKTVNGGIIALLLIVVLWFPLILFALNPALGKPNVPREISVNFKIGDFEVYKFHVSEKSIIKLKDSDYSSIEDLYEKYPDASSFLQDFEPEDVVAAHFGIDSSSLWNPSPPTIDQMISDLTTGKSIPCSFTYYVYRTLVGKNDRESIRGSIEYKLEDRETRDGLIEILKTKEPVKLITIPHIFPKFLHVRNSNVLRNVPQLYVKSRGEFFDYFCIAVVTNN